MHPDLPAQEQAIDEADSKTDLSLHIRLTSGHAPDAGILRVVPD